MKQLIGILSDTHRNDVDEDFKSLIKRTFEQCSTIIHAGDLVSLKILECFADKTVYAVHGNMCAATVRTVLPEARTITIDGCSIAVCHGHGYGYGNTIEERLFERFYPVDCIVYGHTHQATVHRYGDVLFVNPGTFRDTGSYGSNGTYALVSVENTKLSAQIYEVP